MAEKHRFLTNTHNPNDPEARKKGDWRLDYQWQAHLEFIEANIIGLPQAMKHCTLEQQLKSGLVGIYAIN